MSARPAYTRNHYIPQWYQYRFIPSDAREAKLFHLDLHPERFKDATGVMRTKTALRRWGPPSCFYEDDLYTTAFGPYQSTEIEEKFFGSIDTDGRRAVEYFAGFEHPSVDGKAFHAIMRYMSIQKLRTPKGLAYLSSLVRSTNRNYVLMALQELQNLYAAIWTECIWLIADASGSATKFIVSDHPVTVYNRDCFPLSDWCLGHNDPDISLHGTHTIFPLSLNKALILTNLSWVRDPYAKATAPRPNPSRFRLAMFNFSDIQTHRELTETEVREINFVIKRRARRFIAAGKEEWLHPEQHLPTDHWRKLGQGYLFMPDPRSVTFSSEMVIGYTSGVSERYDEYGHQPGQSGFADKERSDREWRTFLAFQGEFASLFGPKRRGRAFHFMDLDAAKDDPDLHAYHLGLEEKYRPQSGRRRRAS